MNLETVAVEEGNTVYDSRNDCNAIIETATGKLQVGSKNTVIPDGVTLIDNHAFEGITGLTSIEFPQSVTALGINCFAGTGLTTINIPASVTVTGEYSGSDYGDFSFMDCTSLREATVASPVYYGMFVNCSSLEKVELASTVTAINDRAFDGCNNLKTLVSHIEEPFAVPDKAFRHTVVGNATLIVPKGTKEKYLALDGWKNFKAIVEEGYYFFATRDKDFRLAQWASTLFNESPDGRGGLSQVTEVDKSFVEELDLVQKLPAIPTEDMTMDCGDLGTKEERTFEDYGPWSNQEVWFIAPQQWYGEKFPLELTNMIDMSIALDYISTISVDGVNYSVFNIGLYSASQLIYKYFDHVTNPDKGDVNSDGEVGIADIVAVTNVMAGTTQDLLTTNLADVNGDGEVGIADIVAVTNIMAGK